MSIFFLLFLLLRVYIDVIQAIYGPTIAQYIVGCNSNNTNALFQIRNKLNMDLIPA